VLTVTEGSNVATINLIGDYLGQTFTLSSGPGGSTNVVDPTTAPAAQLTTTLSPHPFIAAMARFGAPGAGASALDSVNPSASPPMLAVPRALTS
jgi:hypothetical protein